MIAVEVAYAMPERQLIIRIEVPIDCTARQAIVQSGILTEFPELDLSDINIGIFSQPAKLDTTLRDGDRIEIYRPLLMDPKQARFKRVQQQASKKSS